MSDLNLYVFQVKGSHPAIGDSTSEQPFDKTIRLVAPTKECAESCLNKSLNVKTKNPYWGDPFKIDSINFVEEVSIDYLITAINYGLN